MNCHQTIRRIQKSQHLCDFARATFSSDGGQSTHSHAHPAKLASSGDVTECPALSHFYDDVKPFSSVPGPRGISAIPYIGLAFEFKPFTEFVPSIFIKRLAKWQEEYGPVIRFRVGWSWSVSVCDPDDIEKVFRLDNKHPNRGAVELVDVYDKRKGVRPGLLTLSGEEWHQLRIPMQRVVSKPNMLAVYAPKLSQCADDFVRTLNNRDKIVDVNERLMYCTLEGFGVFAFGKRLGCIDKTKEAVELMSYVGRYLTMFGQSNFHTLKPYRFFHTKFYREFEQVSDYLFREIESRVDSTLSEIKSGKNSKWDRNLLQDLVESGTPREKILRTFVDMLIAGIDSTANAMTFVFYHLAKNTDKQELLYKELCDVIPDNEDITTDMIKRLSYVKACVKESMRLIYPVSGGTQRTLDKDIVLNGYVIPKGINILLNSGVPCGDESYFAQHDKFIPERWLRAEGKRDFNPFSYLPFGFGPRKCLGQRFAELEMFIFVAKLLRTYKISLPPGVTDIDYGYRVFATPTNDVTFILEKR